MDPIVAPQRPQIGQPAPAGATPPAKTPAAPVPPRVRFSIELFDEELRPGNHHLLQAQAAQVQADRARAAPAPPRARAYFELFDEELRPGNRNLLQAQAAPPQVAAAEVPPEAGVADPVRAIGDADPERWQRRRLDDVPQVELTWDDALDIVNPLQHIPLISTLYRAATGDQISGAARIIGGSIYGGPVGFMAALVNSVAEEVSGRDLGATALAALRGDDAVGSTAPEVQVAGAGVAVGSDATDATSEPDQPQPAARPATTALTRETPDTTTHPAPGAAEMMSGRAALEAFVRDRREVGQALRQGAPEAARATPSREVVTAARTATQSARAAIAPGAAQAPGLAFGSGSAAPADPLAGFPVAKPGRPFAERMFEALDKYRALAAEGPEVETRRLDDYL